MDLDETIIFAEFSNWIILHEFQVLETWFVGIAGFVEPGGGGFWEGHG